MTRSRSSTKLTATVLAIRFAAGSYASRTRLSRAKSSLVLLEQGARQHVPEEQDDAHDLMRLHAARDDPLGQVPGVVLQRLDAAGLEHLDVVVVDRCGLGGHLLRRHRLEQVRFMDPVCPFLAQPGALLAQVRHELRQQLVLVRRLPAGVSRVRSITSGRFVVHSRPSCRHFVIVTVVPCPGSEAMLNSSISRLAPGSPRPRPW